MGLKFLGIVPYGSVSSDVQALAYCARLGSTRDVVLADFGGDLFKPGHAIALCHSTKAIVVAVRGTIRPWDLISDLVCSSEAFRVLDEAGFAHSGMLRAAHHLDGAVRSQVLRLANSPELSRYRVVICGHSLGAGCASLLGCLWISDPEMVVIRNRLQVFGYGTPAVLSRNLSKAVRSHITTVVMGDDLVPRLSLSSFQRLRDYALSSLSGAPVSAEAPQHHLYPPGRVIWVDDVVAHEHVEDTEAPLPIAMLDATSFTDIKPGPRLVSAHLPQHYAILGDLPLPPEFM